MNKSELIAAISEKSGAKKSEVERVLLAYVDVIRETLQNSQSVQMVGFGVFDVKERAEKMGINPNTKQPITIAACKVPTFKFAKHFKDLLK